jgi:hypothetical protein
MASGATCVQRLDDSRDSAIHTKYRISLRSSSMREPRYPLPRVVMVLYKIRLRHAHRFRGDQRHSLIEVPWRRPRRGSLFDKKARVSPCRSRARGDIAPCPRLFIQVHGSFCWAGFDNDPSAGSPTETLLRLLLPLNDKVQWTSRDVAGSEPPTSPRSEHFTGPFNR